jgi:hypothetical protein
MRTNALIQPPLFDHLQLQKKVRPIERPVLFFPKRSSSVHFDWLNNNIKVPVHLRVAKDVANIAAVIPFIIRKLIGRRYGYVPLF